MQKFLEDSTHVTCRTTHVDPPYNRQAACESKHTAPDSEGLLAACTLCDPSLAGGRLPLSPGGQETKGLIVMIHKTYYAFCSSSNNGFCLVTGQSAAAILSPAVCSHYPPPPPRPAQSVKIAQTRCDTRPAYAATHSRLPATAYRSAAGVPMRFCCCCCCLPQAVVLCAAALS
jgi:hypothetical protein